MFFTLSIHLFCFVMFCLLFLSWFPESALFLVFPVLLWFVPFTFLTSLFLDIPASCVFFFFFLSIFLAFSGFIDSTSRRVWQETVQVREGEQVDPGRESNTGLLQSLGTWVACATDRAKRRPPPFDLAFWLDFTLFKFCFGWACY